MKWLFILLLSFNVIYLGWEVNNETRIRIINSSAAIDVPEGLKPLILISELEQIPAQKQSVTATGLAMEEQHSGNDESLPKLMDIESFSDNPFFTDNNTADSLLSTAMLATDSATNSTKSQIKEPVCFSYGPLPDTNEPERLAEWFLQRNISVDKRQTDDKGRQLFWVYLAPRESKTVAVEALEDLKNKGVKDLRLISHGDLKNAISLGLFSSQALVNRRLGEIKGKGYQPVVVPYYGEKKIHWVDVMLDKNDVSLTAMFSELPSRYNSVAVKCDEIALFDVNP